MAMRLAFSRKTPPDEKLAAALKVEGLTAGYGNLMVLHNLILRVDAGEAVALLGANGVGKTTLLRTISGLIHPRSGSISYGGYELIGARPDLILERGIAHIPQGRQIFAEQTVLDNLLIGAHLRANPEAVRTDLEYMLDVFPALREKLQDSAGSLSGGQQQALAIARGLMSNPRLLLLDEPSLGLAPQLVETVAAVLRTVQEDRGVGMLLVEQDALFALDLTTRGYVMQGGAIAVEASSGELAEASEVVFAYLGGESPGSE